MIVIVIVIKFNLEFHILHFNKFLWKQSIQKFLKKFLKKINLIQRQVDIVSKKKSAKYMAAFLKQLQELNMTKKLKLVVEFISYQKFLKIVSNLNMQLNLNVFKFHIKLKKNVKLIVQLPVISMDPRILNVKYLKLNENNEFYRILLLIKI